MKKLFVTLIAAAAVCACEYGYMEGDFPAKESDGFSYAYPDGNGGEGEPGQGIPGVVTAAEWNDLDNWDFWGKLMTKEPDEQSQGYSSYSSEWGFWTGKRIAVKVTSDGKPAIGVKVALLDGSNEVWAAKTDNQGRADCWPGLHSKNYQTGKLSITLNGQPTEGSPAVTSWSDATVTMNEYELKADAPKATADILFIVDATGSMADEIAFLKADLMDILSRAEKTQLPVTIRTGALFYRDEEDDYLTCGSPFTQDFQTTIGFINDQDADGGGDWPEAVHTALSVSLQEFDWDESARARIAFILLDAPPHKDRQGVMASVHKSIDTYAKMGIKLIPVASSGVDKSLEFLLRFMAVSTGGTYVFITNDSGVGRDHIEATVGEYQVEKLGDLMVRLIQKYLE
ncbi:MAG: hypothetical protein IKZ91_02170 [Bacteroidales bacterium]|nr:hypothetical protein [Bacteroidales bacterium]